jgi:hypothetical protein
VSCDPFVTSVSCCGLPLTRGFRRRQRRRARTIRSRAALASRRTWTLADDRVVADQEQSKASPAISGNRRAQVAALRTSAAMFLLPLAVSSGRGSRDHRSSAASWLFLRICLSNRAGGA